VDQKLNATQGSLLGFLHDGPRTGWELLQAVRAGLSRFWNITPSHVYRELQVLQERKLIAAGTPGVRDRRPFTITSKGRRAFAGWIAEVPGPEQIRIPLLVTLWFGRHLAPAELSGILRSNRNEHEERLRLYTEAEVSDPYARAVVAFGIAYERATIGWIDEVCRSPLLTETSNST